MRKLGDRLFLVGVAHVLPKSSREVREVILRERPVLVALELCKNRYSALARQAKGVGFLDALRARKLPLFLLGSLLHLLQSRFARQTGTPAGEEMLVAARLARKVNAEVELIDRDINVTLQRLVERTRGREKFRLLAELLLGFLPIGKRFDLEKLTEEEVVERLLREFMRASKTAYEVLVEERNAYMAKKIAMLFAKTSGKIVCVVGAGHVPGLAERLSHRWNISYEWAIT